MLGTNRDNKMNDETFSDCCGTSTTDTEMGICPDCLEHCEFISSHMCINCGELEVEVEGQPCSKECNKEYWADMGPE